MTIIRSVATDGVAAGRFLRILAQPRLYFRPAFPFFAGS
jgi:hypothetical protein